MFLQNTFLIPCLRVPCPYTDDRNQFILKQKLLLDFNTYSQRWHRDSRRDYSLDWSRGVLN